MVDPAQVAAVARAFMKPDRLENWITPEFIRWRVASPTLKLRFLGCVDEAGVLSSYLILAEHEIKKQPAWLMVDWFTTGEGIQEVLAMLGGLSRDPGMIGEARRMVEAAVFEPEVSLWAGAPALVDLPRPASYYFLTPPGMENCVKRCVLADGDFGM